MQSYAAASSYWEMHKIQQNKTTKKWVSLRVVAVQLTRNETHQSRVAT